MKITEDRLAVALAVLEKNGSWLLPDEIRAVIAAIPEPPDDSPATLPAPDVQAQEGLSDEYKEGGAHAIAYLTEDQGYRSPEQVQAQTDAARADEREAIIDAIGGIDGPADYRRAMWDVLRIIAARSGARGV